MQQAFPEEADNNKKKGKTLGLESQWKTHKRMSQQGQRQIIELLVEKRPLHLVLKREPVGEGLDEERYERETALKLKAKWIQEREREERSKLKAERAAARAEKRKQKREIENWKKEVAGVIEHALYGPDGPKEIVDNNWPWFEDTAEVPDEIRNLIKDMGTPNFAEKFFSKFSEMIRN